MTPGSAQVQEQYTPLVVAGRHAEARAVLAREYGAFCFACRQSPPDCPSLTLDHIVPVARGGLDIYPNWQLLCVRCNVKKHTRVMDYRPGTMHLDVIAPRPIIPHDQRSVKRRPRRIPKRAIPLPMPKFVVRAPSPPRQHAPDAALVALSASLAALTAALESERAERQQATQAAQGAAVRAAAAEAEAAHQRTRADDLVRRVQSLERPFWRRWFGE